MTTKRYYLWIALACLVVALALVVAGTADARPAQCVAIVDGATLDAAQAELMRYSSALQTGELDATMGHVVRLSELAQALSEAPRMGCDSTAAVTHTAVTHTVVWR